MTLTLNDRVIIITGAGSGIGRAIAEQVAAAGAHALVADLNEQGANETVAAITSAGGAATAAVGDISDPEVVTRIVEQAAGIARIGGLVNNAGVMDLFAGAATTDDATWERCLRINLTAPFLLIRAVVPRMLEAGGGSIVTVGSEAGLRGAAAGAAYTSSKHGVVGLTRNTAYTYAKDGIRTNAVMPAGVETNIMSSIDQTKIDQESFAKIQPVHAGATRMAKPDEIASLVLYLLADEAINVNGAIIPSDGGWFAG